MHPKIPIWEAALNQITSAFKSEFGGLDDNALNWKPSPDIWSIGQVVDHLIVINKTYFSVIDQLTSDTYKKPFMARFGFMVNMLGNSILKSVEPTRRKKIKTFPIWEPAKSNIPGNIIEQFEIQQQELIELIKICEDLLNKRAVISSPANKNIVYTLEKAFDIITTHEERHLNQAREIDEMRKRFIT